MRLSVILPAKDECENIEPLLGALRSVLVAYPSAEIIAVDDGSTDGTTEILQRLTQTMPMLRVLVLARSYGQTAAIAAGMEAAQGDVLLPMDADGQNDPHEIPRFLAEIEKGFDVVSGWRRDRHDNRLRSLLSRIANRLIRRACGQDIHDYGCTMKAYRRSVIENVGLFGDMHRFLVAYMALQGARVCEIVVNHRPRMHGRSKYGLGRVWRVLLDLLLLLFFLKSFTRPMHFFGGIGLIFSVLGILTTTAALLWRFIGGVSLIDTPLPMLSALFLIIGVQCILMGVLAEMVMRTYFQVQPSRRAYRVRAMYPT